MYVDNKWVELKDGEFVGEMSFLTEKVLFTQLVLLNTSHNV